MVEESQESKRGDVKVLLTIGFAMAMCAGDAVKAADVSQVGMEIIGKPPYIKWQEAKDMADACPDDILDPIVKVMER